jgi:ferric-dicitrate binding protein FerR (iron transport regulator)
MPEKEELNLFFIEVISSPQYGVEEIHLEQFYSLADKMDQTEIKNLAQYVDIWQAAPLIRNDYSPVVAFDNIREHLQESKIQSRTKIPGSKSRYLSILVAAIIIPILYFIFSHLKNNSTESKLTYSEYHVPYGSRSKITLPDGTLAWLNAGSTLIYSSDYNTKNRLVQLEGEAFFEVKKIPGKSFTASTDGASVKVLGTSFNLKAYPEENIVETTVTSGVVEVCNKSFSKTKSKKIVLKANEKIRLKKSSKSELKERPKNDSSIAEIEKPDIQSIQDVKISRNIDPSVSSSWKENEWIIESERLSEFAVKMERRFNISIYFTDENIKDHVFSGRLKDENLTQMLEAICKTAPIKYNTKNDRVYLSERITE